MAVFSDDLSIQGRSIQQQKIRGTGPVSMETAKSQSALFTLNSRRLSIDYNVVF